MGKWIAGIVGAVITGAILWVLTDRYLPILFPDRSHPPPPPGDAIRVECTANPATVAPGGTTEISIKVTNGGEPVEGATVELPGGGGAGETYSGGIFRTTWTAPSPSAAAYVFPANVKLADLRTAKGELNGSYGTNCEILVH